LHFAQARGIMLRQVARAEEKEKKEKKKGDGTSQE
jgi:hypothetical protein